MRLRAPRSSSIDRRSRRSHHDHGCVGRFARLQIPGQLAERRFDPFDARVARHAAQIGDATPKLIAILRKFARETSSPAGSRPRPGCPASPTRARDDHGDSDRAAEPPLEPSSRGTQDERDDNGERDRHEDWRGLVKRRDDAEKGQNAGRGPAPATLVRPSRSSYAQPA